VASSETLENDFLKVTFSPDGSIVSIIDKRLSMVIPSQRLPTAFWFINHGARGISRWIMPIPNPYNSFWLPALDRWSAGCTGQIYAGRWKLVQEINLTAGSGSFPKQIARETATMLRAFFPASIFADEAV
jgi:hypothetical protein